MSPTTGRRSWFRRRTTVPADPVITTQDAEVARAHGLKLPQWLDLTDQARAMLRQSVTSAPYFHQKGSS